MTELLSNEGYIMYNKKLAGLLGVHEAILIGELCAKYQYWLDKGALIETDGWFYITRDEIEKDTGLTAKQQRSALQHLKGEQLIDCCRMGVPAKMYYYLNVENLHDLMLQKGTSVQAKRSQLDDPKGNDINMYSKKDNKKEKEDILVEADASAQQAAITLTLNDKSEYPIYQQQVEEWAALYPAVDVMQELRKMRGWLQGNPQKRKTSRGVLRFIISWLAREQDKGRCTSPKRAERWLE